MEAVRTFFWEKNYIEFQLRKKYMSISGRERERESSSSQQGKTNCILEKGHFEGLSFWETFSKGARIKFPSPFHRVDGNIGTTGGLSIFFSSFYGLVSENLRNFFKDGRSKGRQIDG